jgi:hypothetical protein
MKTIRELREAALNEARKNKWTDNDPYWSKNTNGRVAAKGKIKLDVTELWEHAEPFKKFKDNKAIANTGKGDQNKRQHAFWEKRYDIKITGEHFDASAKNERGAVVPRVYNIMGLPLDIEINKKMKKGSEYRYKYVSRGSKHKIWYTGEKQDIYDFFTSNEWTSKNRTNLGPYHRMEKALGVMSQRDAMPAATRKAIDNAKRADGFEWDDKKLDYVWVGLPKK